MPIVEQKATLTTSIIQVSATNEHGQPSSALDVKEALTVLTGQNWLEVSPMVGVDGVFLIEVPETWADALATSGHFAVEVLETRIEAEMP